MGFPSSGGGFPATSSTTAADSVRTQTLKRSLKTAQASTATQESSCMTHRPKTRIVDKYKIIGFISSGTYGRVYKATGKQGQPGVFAIKKFKPDKEGEVSYTGISQSAVREMALCTELSHENVIRLVEIMLEDRCIFMVFDYCEHDLLQIIHYHNQQQPRRQLAAPMLKSIMFQLLNGCQYLHANWVMHRDLKPANIMVTGTGVVKIGDLGLARLFNKPLQSLFSGDKVVVTIWYRAPELLLGSRHYTPAVDLWAIGCIMAELMSLRPIFKGEEAKMDNKKVPPFQRSQMQKIMDVIGAPTKERWPLLASMPDYPSLLNHLNSNQRQHQVQHGCSQYVNHLDKWYYSTISQNKDSRESVLKEQINAPLISLGREGYQLLSGLLEYDPQRRLTAKQALEHPFFAIRDTSTPGPTATSPAVSTDSISSLNNCFDGLKERYPMRRVAVDDNDMRTLSLPGTMQKRPANGDESLRARKRVKQGS